MCHPHDGPAAQGRFPGSDAAARRCPHCGRSSTPITPIEAGMIWLGCSFSKLARALDPKMKGYGEIYGNIDAITAQTDPSCALDIVTDTESNGVHKLDVGVVLQLKSKADRGRVERRRERVQIEMRLIKGKWKITAFAPLSILDPIQIV